MSGTIASKHTLTRLRIAPQLQVDAVCFDHTRVPSHLKAAVDAGRAVVLPPCRVDQGRLKFSIQFAGVNCRKEVTSRYHFSGEERAFERDWVLPESHAPSLVNVVPLSKETSTITQPVWYNSGEMQWPLPFVST